MADNSLPERDLSQVPEAAKNVDDERRAFLRRAAVAGLPVVLATVRGRTVFASQTTASCPASANMSSCGGF